MPVFLVALVLVNIPTVTRAIDAGYRSPLAAAYSVESFTVNGQPAAAEKATTQWRLVGIDNCQRFAVRTVDDRQFESEIVLDGAGPSAVRQKCAERTLATSGTITLRTPMTLTPGLVQAGPGGVLRYERQGNGVVELSGKLGDSEIQARLKKIPDDQFNISRYPNAF